MYKVKTFSTPLEIFKTQGELTALDERVNEFIASSPGIRVVSVSDSVTASDGGSTIGLIRALTYEVPG